MQTFKIVNGEEIFIFFRTMDLQMMDAKAQAGEYEHLEEFKADAQTIVHNVVIYHGGTACFLVLVLLQ